MDSRNTWVGFGAKFGGTLIAGRIESTTGVIMNLERPDWSSLFTIESQGIGLGLGGGTVGVLVVAFNCPSIFVMDHSSMAAWDVGFSIGAKLSTLAKALAQAKEWKAVYPIAQDACRVINRLRAAQIVAGRATQIIHGEQLVHLKEGIEVMHKTFEIDEHPIIVPLDIPGSGYGLEVGLTRIQGYFNLL